MADFTRRQFTVTLLAGFGATALPVLSGCRQETGTTSPEQADIPRPTSPAGDAWALAEEIRRSISLPRIPAKDFLLTDFGAIGDGQADCTDAFRQAIAACKAEGGGRIVVPAGVYATGPIHLSANMELHLQENSRIAFIPEPDRYLPAVFTRWEGMEMMGYSPLIYAYGVENVAVTGKGILDGGADDDTWWPWKGDHGERHWSLIDGEDQAEARAALEQDTEAGVPPQERVYAEGSWLRPSFVQFYSCKNVLIEGVTVVNSPFWLLHPVLSENVTVRGVTCRSHGPNNDGCDPESCRNVLIEDCLFDTGDDCIAIKSGRNADGRRVNVPSENFVVARCRMADGHGGVVLGSEISGGVRNVFVEDCEMSSEHLERAIRIKTNSVRGGVIENLYVRNLRIGQVQDAVVVNFYYEEGDAGNFLPVVRNIHLDNIQCQQARRAFYIRGYERSPVQGLTVSNSSFGQVAEASVIEHLDGGLARNVDVNGKQFSFKG